VRSECEPIPRGRPEWASSEEDWILDLLRKADAEGVSREYLIFTCRSTQCGRAINSLEKRGYVIEHVKLAGENYVRYVLRSEPLRENPVSGNWYVEKFHRLRPSDRPKETSADLPLFNGAGK